VLYDQVRWSGRVGLPALDVLARIDLDEPRLQAHAAAVGLTVPDDGNRPADDGGWAVRWWGGWRFSRLGSRR
jgi:hypothetical protein